MTVAATVFAAFAPFWLGLYTNSADVVRAASSLLVISAVLLMGDTLFVLIASSLTGVGDTKTPLVVSISSGTGSSECRSHTRSPSLSAAG